MIALRHRRVRLVGFLFATAVGVATLSSCGPPRTAAEFCKVYEQQKHEYLARYRTIANGEADGLAEALAGIGRSLQAMGDWVVIFDKLDRVAPDDIEPDVARIRDTLKEEQRRAEDNAANPLAGLVGNLATALMTSGSWDRVNRYVIANCDNRS